jgi:hypothetical protein
VVLWCLCAPCGFWDAGAIAYSYTSLGNCAFPGWCAFGGVFLLFAAVVQFSGFVAGTAFRSSRSGGVRGVAMRLSIELSVSPVSGGLSEYSESCVVCE